MSSKSHGNTRARHRLHAADPHCHWCGRETRLVQPTKRGGLPPDAATVDHLYSKLDPRRHEPGGGRHKVLACHQCNMGRSKAEHAALSPEQRRNATKWGGKHLHKPHRDWWEVPF